MDEDGQTPIHRRSNSLLQDPLDQHATSNGVYKHSPELADPDDMRISEEQDRESSDTDLDMNDPMHSDAESDNDEETGLTHSERKKRRRRRKKHTLLDERIAGSNPNTASPEYKLATSYLLKDTITNALLIALWYTFSISISVYNKWMFSAQNLDFHYPLFTTSLHMLVQFGLASAVLFCIPSLRPKPPPPLNNNNNATTKQPLMTRTFYLTRILPCGTATALDIGLGNFSLRFITLTFFTMCKSSVLIFVLTFAFLFRLESPTWKLCAIILVMTAGVVMMVAGEAAFNTAGFVLVMSASFCSGFRWSLTQILLLRNPATGNPFSGIFFLTPVMFFALFILAVPIEGPFAVIEGVKTLMSTHGTLLSLTILLFPGCLAFLMVAAEFALLKRTSVVTLSVCGIFKEVLTISAAGLAFGDELSPINVSGLFVTIASIAAYNYLKIMKMRSEARKEAHKLLEEDADAMPLETSPERRTSSSPGGRESTSDSLSLVAEMNGGHGSKYLSKGVQAGGGDVSPVHRTVDHLG